MKGRSTIDPARAVVLALAVGALVIGAGPARAAWSASKIEILPGRAVADVVVMSPRVVLAFADADGDRTEVFRVPVDGAPQSLGFLPGRYVQPTRIDAGLAGALVAVGTQAAARTHVFLVPVDAAPLDAAELPLSASIVEYGEPFAISTSSDAYVVRANPLRLVRTLIHVDDAKPDSSAVEALACTPNAATCAYVGRGNENTVHVITPERDTRLADLHYESGHSLTMSPSGRTFALDDTVYDVDTARHFAFGAGSACTGHAVRYVGPDKLEATLIVYAPEIGEYPPCLAKPAHFVLDVVTRARTAIQDPVDDVWEPLPCGFRNHRAGGSISTACYSGLDAGLGRRRRNGEAPMPATIALSERALLLFDDGARAYQWHTGAGHDVKKTAGDPVQIDGPSIVELPARRGDVPVVTALPELAGIRELVESLDDDWHLVASDRDEKYATPPRHPRYFFVRVVAAPAP